MKKTKTWEQFEAGRAYKRRIGLYETVSRNERFYRGEQWEGGSGEKALPKPVFNVVRRITDYLVGAVAGGKVVVTYLDESLSPQPTKSLRTALKDGVGLLNRHVAYRWENCRMDRLVYRLLLSAAISGDGVLYCYWDKDARGGSFGGDIRTVCRDSCELYAADMNRPDIQSQEYIILAGRESVGTLRRRARAAGLNGDAIKRILPDAHLRYEETGRACPELEDSESAKATVLHKFWREDGVVWMEESCAEVVIRRVCTGMKLYPVAYFNWMPTAGSFHGTSPVSGMIANQKFINRAYGMVMKHMTDTAFSKVIYDKSRIPEWSNEVGEAIAAAGGDLRDAVQVVGVGQMQDGYMALIESAIAMTKEMAGATDAVLGSENANNTSAILALQEASRTMLRQVNAAYAQCLEDVADIWADMLCAVCGKEHLLPYYDGDRRRVAQMDFDLLHTALLRARVEVGNMTQYSTSGTQNALDKLLDGGHITLAQYLEQLPAGILPMRNKLLGELKQEDKREGGAPDGDDAANNGNG